MIFVLLPAYNEEDALKPLLEKIDGRLTEAGYRYKVVVVNDGSSDGTAEVLEELSRKYPIHVITHKYNRGLGETARDGFEYVAEVGGRDDVVVRMDSDDTHDPKYIPAMIDRLNDGYEVVTTSRYVPGGGQVGVDLYRRTLSRCANLLLKACFPIRGLKEYTCGYRAYRVSFLQDALAIFGNQFIDLKGMGFTGTVEKMIKARLMRARVGEVPFTLRYDLKPGLSKVATNITTLGYFVLIAKYIVYWGDIGQEWKRKIGERYVKTYDEHGKLRADSVKVT